MTYITTATVPELTVVETRRTDLRAGDDVGVRIEPSQIHLFDSEGGLAI
jgi:multiple sugar transport system ATP-binding protein